MKLATHLTHKGYDIGQYEVFLQELIRYYTQIGDLDIADTLNDILTDLLLCEIGGKK